MESHIEQEFESCADFLDDFMGDGCLFLVHPFFHGGHPFVERLQFHVGHLGDVLAIDAEVECLFVKTFAATFGTHDHLIDRFCPFLCPCLLLVDVESLHIVRHLLVIDVVHIDGWHDAKSLAVGTGALWRVEREVMGSRVAVAESCGGAHEFLGIVTDRPSPCPPYREGAVT